MRRLKCSVFIASSLDGYIARQDGSIDWLTGASEHDEDYGYRAFFATIDCLVIGRKTYETVLTFGQWPYEGRKVALLTSNAAVSPNRMDEKISIVAAAPTEIVESLAAMGCAHAYVDGGKTIQTFVKAGFIDEMTITTIPILLGEGIPLFGKVNSDIRLRHLETKSYPNGFVQTKYFLPGTKD